MGEFQIGWVWAAILLITVAATAGAAQSSSSSDHSLPSLPQPLAGAHGAETEDLDHLSPQDSAKRNALIQPGLKYLEQGDNEAAFESFRSVLTAYPDDFSVLRFTAAAAMAAGQNEQALVLFHRALAQNPHNPWTMRNAVIILEARLNRWADFDRDVAALRSAKRNGMDRGLDGSTGFVIDEFYAGGEKIQGTLYPLQAGRFHTLYRFLMPPGRPLMLPDQSSATAAAAARCTDPDFQPHFDAESGDVDQAEFAKAHPDKAAKGDRSYMLDAYSSPCTQGLVAFYPDGEPTYEKARADVIRALTGPVRH
jgi:tetratricopeptide (TPR) repeat protein